MLYFSQAPSQQIQGKHRPKLQFLEFEKFEKPAVPIGGWQLMFTKKLMNILGGTLKPQQRWNPNWLHHPTKSNPKNLRDSGGMISSL